jgi:hypothetical protein
MIMRRLALPLALVLFLTLVPVEIAAAGRYVHPEHGFTLGLPKGWSETPTRVDFKAQGVIAKFKAKSKGTDFATLDIYRFGADPAVATPTEEPQDPRDLSPERLQRLMRPKAAGNAEDALLDMLSQRINMINRVANGMGHEPVEPILELPKGKKVKLGKSGEGAYYVFEIEQKRLKRYSFYLVGGIAKRGEEEYLLAFMCSWSQRKKSYRAFVSCFRSFRFPGERSARDTDEDDDEDEPEDWEKDADFLDPEKRARVKGKLIDTWRSLDTPHYIVLYHEKDRNLSRIVARRIERLRTLWEEDFPPLSPITSVMVIRLCPDKDTYYHYGAPRGTGGYWASGHDEFVFPSFTGRDKQDETTLGVLHHEGWHQYFHYALEGRSTPIAMNEGLAEYYFCAEPRGKRWRIGNRHPMRHSTVKTAASTGNMIPFREFIRLTQREHYSKAQLCYSQGWALFYWLMKGTRNPQYREIPMKLYRALAEQPKGFSRDGWRKAVDQALEGIDEDKLHEDFLKGIKKVM